MQCSAVQMDAGDGIAVKRSTIVANFLLLLLQLRVKIVGFVGKVCVCVFFCWFFPLFRLNIYRSFISQLLLQQMCHTMNESFFRREFCVGRGRGGFGVSLLLSLYKTIHLQFVAILSFITQSGAIFVVAIVIRSALHL